ncbi:MAG: delta-60 repeat domain-containing protein [Verrucomicrobiota bacterium]
MNRCARVHPVFVLFFLLLMVQVRAKEAGLLDRSFDPGTGADSDIRALLVYPTGEALIGGAFTNFDGRGRAGIARLLPAGVLDTSFDTGAGIGGVGHWQSGRAVEALAVQTDGKVIAGGAFTEFNGQLHLRLARLDATGVPDPGFNATVTDASDPVAPVHNGAFSSAVRVRALAIDQKGRILIGGVFTYVNGVARPNLARLNPDGSTDEDFALDSPFSYNDEVVFVHLREDGRILIGGVASSVIRRQSVRTRGRRPAGTRRIDPSFQVNLPFGFVANSLAPVSSGQALVGKYLMDGQPNQTACFIGLRSMVRASLNSSAKCRE